MEYLPVLLIEDYIYTTKEVNIRMNKTSLLLGVTAVIVGGLVTIPQAVLAYKGDPTMKGPNYTEERHEAMEKAFENKDFAAWKSLMNGKGRVTQVVTEQNFSKFAEAHALTEQGNIEGAKKIRAELGLGLQNGTSHGMGYGRTNR